MESDVEWLTLVRHRSEDRLWPWADAHGCDRYGLWTEIHLSPITGQGEPVVQRLRWIPPGQFEMGSPEDEPGRYDDEGPRHPVTIEKGYWIFDTPVTQELYEAVTGENPSRFRSPDRPVESVSWFTAHAFLSRLNRLRPGLTLRLPSEAQWEYACRAGTTTAIPSGAMAILGANNAPALDPVSWYGGNSGVDYTLERGTVSAEWPERQHQHTLAGTHPVARKAANPFGLYDMLGNVWEWCADLWHFDYEAAPEHEAPWNDIETLTQGFKPDEVERIVRGGSWIGDARRLRSACRFRRVAGSTLFNVGFRCINGEES
ncbi:MAG: formylglycine-generating enzyme family protein [Magnetococcales bacterium]|nr:formylglycine-generating enzyme family protein [Magnetococcales bacterium]